MLLVSDTSVFVSVSDQWEGSESIDIIPIIGEESDQLQGIPDL